ncbi:MAG: metallophosphoesterase [Aliishimia sp.]
MTKLIWLSGIHFAQEGDVFGHDPKLRLQSAIDHVTAQHADAALCVITGDVVNNDCFEDYQAVASRLKGLQMPFLTMVGNHDDRALFRQVFSLPDTCMKGCVQYTVPIDEGTIVCLDTHKIGSDAGEFCEVRRDWLHKTLKESGCAPVFLFMHHPPLALDLPMQDTEKLENGAQFLKLVSQFDCVQHLFIVHVHRPITGTVSAIAFGSMHSGLCQAPPPRREWSWRTFKPAQEAPSLGVVQTNGSTVTLQYEQFCTYEFGALDAAK